ncbi:unnamed protein product, partial [Rotaria sp. Silwood2]
SAFPVTEEEISVSKPLLIEQVIEQEQTTTTSLLDTLKDLLPSGLKSTEIEDISSDESVPIVKEDQTAIPSVFTEPRVASISKEDLAKPTQTQVDTQGKVAVSGPAAGYFSSSDVYHAYKQPVEPIIEHKPDSSSFIDKATAFASSIISSVTSALPTTETIEDLTSTTEATTGLEITIVSV